MALVQAVRSLKKILVARIKTEGVKKLGNTIYVIFQAHLFTFSKVLVM